MPVRSVPVHGDQASAAIAIGDESPRAADASRADCTHLNGTGLNPTNAGDPRALWAERSDASLRSQRSHEHWITLAPSQRPLALASTTAAQAFDGLMHDHWMRGEDNYSNVAVARSCGVDEKQVREWRLGEKRMPLSALLVLPSVVATEIVMWVTDQRGIAQRQRVTVALAESLDRLDKPIGADDRDEVLRALLDAQRRIGERIARLATGGR